MNIKEALSILKVENGASRVDVNKAFRKLAAEKHPDAGGDEAEFKKLNEAYQVLQKEGTTFEGRKSQGFYRPPTMDDFSGFMNLDPFYQVMHQDFLYQEFVKSATRTKIGVPVTITFEESVLGCVKEIIATSTTACSCVKNAKKTDKCDLCLGTKRVAKKGPMTITIDGPVKDGTGIKTASGTDVRITVLPDPDMYLDGNDVVSSITVSLPEALKGAKKKLRTVKGEKMISIKPKTKNGDVMRVSGFGAGKVGAHIVKINVDYPDDIEPLIAVLEKKDGI